MKKLLSMLLVLTLLGSLALPAAAEEDASARLTKVTQAVKTRLDLDTDAYEDFHGECYDEELAAIWYLRWENGPNDSSLSIEALEDGTVISYRVNTNDAVPVYWRGDLPKFPEEQDASADRETAEAFLKKVLVSNETAELEDRGNQNRLLNDTGSYFTGEILLNGVLSPMTCNLTIEGGKVVRFNRGVQANTFLGAVPDPKAAADQSGASAELREKLAVRLAYVKAAGEEKQAVLRYLPETGLHTFYVDAHSGEVLDITELEKDLRLGGITKNSMAEDSAEAPMAAASGADRGLSSAEQAGVEKLSGVLSAEKLDASLRAVAAYGLDGYTLTSTSYTLETDYMTTSIAKGPDGEEERKPVCRLRYVLAAEKSDKDGKTESPEDTVKNRTFTVDARTGEVLGLYSSTPWGRDAVLTEAQALEKAEAFLKTFAPDRTVVLQKSTANQETKAPYYSFSFSREVNGCPFEANYYNISIDNQDGFLYSLNYIWDEDMTFESPEGVITPAAAKNAWADTYEVKLAYRLVPQVLDGSDPVQARLIAQGIKRYYGLRLTYALNREDYCEGINAKTGEPVYPEKNTAGREISYTDVRGHSAQADIEKLARYGVGYASSEFRPGKIMTQWEFVCLLASVNGQCLDPAAASKSDRDYAYDAAYSMGALTRAERSDESAVSRNELVKMLLNAAGYGPAARLKGIYTTSYGDQASIPAGDLGYAAIAQALGLAKETYGAARNASRAEAASMLCRILERS